MTKKANIYLRSGQTVTTLIDEEVEIVDIHTDLVNKDHSTYVTVDGVFRMSDIAGIKILEVES